MTQRVPDHAGVEIQEVGPARDWGRGPGPRVRRLLLGTVAATLVGVGAWQHLAEPEPVRPSPRQIDGPLLTADAGPVGAGFTVLVGGDNPVLVDPSDGGTTPIRGLPPGAGTLRSAVRTAEGLIGVVTSGAASADPGRLFRVDGAGKATAWGRGDAVQPGDHGDVLVVTRDAAGLESLASMVDGSRVRWRRPLARLTQMVKSTPLGLVVQVVPDVRSHEDGDLLVVDARTGAVRRRLGPVLRVLAVSERTVAATRVGCAPDCPLLTINLATGTQEETRLPGDPVPAAAAFTSDGSRLAVSTFGLARTDGSDPSPADPHTGRVLVLDLATGRIRQLPGLRTGRNEAADVAWDPADAALLLAVKWPTYERIARWDPSSDRLRVLPLRIPGHRPLGSLFVHVVPPEKESSS